MRKINSSPTNDRQQNKLFSKSAISTLAQPKNEGNNFITSNNRIHRKENFHFPLNLNFIILIFILSTCLSNKIFADGNSITYCNLANINFDNANTGYTSVSTFGTASIRNNSTNPGTHWNLVGQSGNFGYYDEVAGTNFLSLNISTYPCMTFTIKFKVASLVDPNWTQVSPAKFDVKVNGIVAGSVSKQNGSYPQWQVFSFSYTLPAGTPVNCPITFTATNTNGTSAGGDLAIDDIVIEAVQEVPTTSPTSPTNRVICKNSSLTFSASNVGCVVPVWSSSSLATGSLPNQTGASITNTFYTQTLYTYSVNYNHVCITNPPSFTVQVWDKPTISLTASPNVFCSGSSTTVLNTTVTNTSASSNNYVYLINGTATTPNTNTYTPTDLTIPSGSFSISNSYSSTVAVANLTDGSCISNSLTTTLTNVLEPTNPVISALNNQNKICDGALVNLNSSIVAQSYQWSYSPTSSGTFTLLANSNAVNYQATLSGYYKVTVINGTAPNTCSKTSTTPFYVGTCACDDGITYDAGYEANTINHVSSNITWTGNRTINGIVEIDPGITLTISNCTMQFGPQGGIVVKKSLNTSLPGATLIIISSGTLNTTKLTGVSNAANAWSGCMWRGIDVEGSGNSGCICDGKVNIQNATIEHALCAVYLAERPTSNILTATPNNAGGKITTNKAVFNDNYVGVCFPINNQRLVSSSYFLLSEFKCTGNLRQPTYCDATIVYPNNIRSKNFIKAYAWQFTNTLVNTCGFRNTLGTNQTSYSNYPANRTIAIDATSCILGIDKSNFNGLNKAIWLKYDPAYTSNNIKVNCNNFEYVAIGVLSTGGSRSYIQNNKLSKGYFSLDLTQPNMGVVLDGGGYTEINNNDITDYDIGIASFNGGISYITNPINIFKNSIRYTNPWSNSAPISYTAILLGGANNYTQVRCNNLLENYHTGILFNRNLSYNSQVAQVTSTVPSQPQVTSTVIIAGNEFTPHVGSYDLSRFGPASYWNFNPYYYHNNSTFDWYKQKPINIYNLNTTDVVATGGSFQFGITSNALYCAQPSSGLAATSPIAPLTCYNSAYNFPVPHPKPGDVGSNGTVEESAMRSVEEILNDIDNASDEDYIRQLKAELMFVMSALKYEEEAIAFLQQQNTIEDDKYLVDVYLGNDMITDAASLLSIFPDGTIDEVSYKELYNIFIDLKLQDRSLEELTQTEQLLIEAIKGLDNPISGIAINILNNYFGLDYEMPCEKKGYCENSGARKAQVDNVGLFNDALNKVKTERAAKTANGMPTVLQKSDINMSLMPNPAKDVLQVNYILTNKTLSATIQITDVMGNLVFTDNLDAQNRAKTINVATFSNGIYNVSIIANNKVFSHQKFVVNN